MSGETRTRTMSAKHDLDALVALAQAGANQAAGAFAQLIGQSVEALPPIVAEEGATAGGSDPESTGVFFELDGCLEALIGIVFPGRASETLVRRIVGIETGELASPIIESALMEVGNILASHVASAIADRLGERLLPSIPSLAMAHAQVEFEAFIERVVGPDAPRIETGLASEGGTVDGYLVLVPTD
ncbi:MAG: chemotaxis protein CheC [Myxococcota bacterium]